MEVVQGPMSVSQTGRSLDAGLDILAGGPYSLRNP